MHVLDTGRLTLRWLEPGDAGFILELTNDPDWLRHIGDRGIRSLDDATRYIAEGPRAMCQRLGFGLYCVVLREAGTAIGLCGLIKRDWLEDVDVGFALLPAFRGRGYAFEAAAATLRFGRERLGLPRIAAIVSPTNAASIGLLQKLGLRYQRMVMPPNLADPTCLYETAATDGRSGLLPGPTALPTAEPADGAAAASRARVVVAGPEHAADVLRLLAIQLREHRIELEPARLEATFQGVLADPSRGLFLVLELDGRRIGAAYVSFIWALEHGGQSAWLEELYVEPACRGTGLGTAFLQEVLDECAARGCAALDLEIDVEHERVRSLYLRNGFDELPRGRMVRRLAPHVGEADD